MIKAVHRVDQFYNWKVKCAAIFGGQAISLFGSQIVQFAIIWWLAKASNSATVLTIAGVAGMVPAIVFGPMVGVLVDRWNRRAIMIASDVCTAMLTLGLLLLFSLDKMANWHIYSVILLRSITGTFHSLSMQSTISLLVPKEHLIRVAGLRQTFGAVMSIGAPLIGALLVIKLPMNGIILIDALSCMIATLPLLFIPFPKHRNDSAAVLPVWSSMKEGFLYIWSWKALFMLCVLAAILNLFIGSVSMLLPIMVTRHYGSTVGTLSVFESVFAGGMIAGGLVLSVWSGFNKRIYTLILGIVGLGVAICAFGIAPRLPFYFSCGSVFLAGIMIIIANAPVSAILQMMVPHEKQGRVFATVASLCSVSVPLGLSISGPLSDVFDVSTVYIAIGFVCLLIGLVALGLPGLKSIEEQSQG